MMGRIHLLPGSTDSSPTVRGSYQSEDEAQLTLAELNEWLYLEIAGQYHHTIHRVIGTTPAEEQEGYGLIGRIRRMSASEYGEQRMTRILQEVAHPKVRAAALWTAHAFMATCHIAASDRPSGRTTQDRQAAWLSRSAPADRQWPALRQESWPLSYRRERWIDLREFT
jgi:hypothetical protein